MGSTPGYRPGGSWWTFVRREAGPIGLLQERMHSCTEGVPKLLARQRRKPGLHATAGHWQQEDEGKDL